MTYITGKPASTRKRTSRSSVAYGSHDGSIFNEVQNFYNDFGQVVTEYQEHGGAVNTGTSLKVQYAYADGSSNTIPLTKMTYPDGRELNYNYGSSGCTDDSLSRVASLIDDDGSTHVVDYSYLGAGAIIQADYAQPDVRFDLAHGAGDDPYDGPMDRFDRITDLLWYDYGSSADLLRFKHGYDRASNRLYREEADTSDLDQLYSYARGQLTGATYDYQDGESYVYDANGNRTGGDYVVGDHNRLLSDGTYNYEYDGEGNRTKRTNLATGAVTEYVWDHRNRLVAVIDRMSEDGPVVQSVEYVYDSQNRWIANSVDPDGDGPEEPQETHFVYQGNQIVLQIDGEGQVTNRYLWGPAVDQILADEQVQHDGTGEVLWPLTDHLNTVRDLAVYAPQTDVTTVVNHIVYDAFGRVTGQTDASVTTLFGFTARPFDSATGLQNNLNRWYDAETGTWISVDPMGFAAADTNLYRYVGNGSTIVADPTGFGFGVDS